MAGTVERVRDLGARHAELEAKQDLEGTLATLVAEPEYEFWPVGRRMRGAAQVRRYYEHLFREFVPRTRSYRLLGEWASESGVAQEYEIELEIDGQLEKHRVVGILLADGDLLGGERVYGSERCIRLMTGPLFDELTPIEEAK